MSIVRRVDEKKSNGVHFTPSPLARFVAKRIINAVSAHFLDTLDTIEVLDPACGDGELLLAFADMLPQHYLEKVIFIGIESSEQALERAEQRIRQSAIKKFRLEKADFLELCKQVSRQPTLFDQTLSDSVLKRQANIIIANPPYVRTQVLGAVKAQELSSSFGLSGRVDLYQAFLVAMTRQLAIDGILGVITSNRFLSTKGGLAVRELIANTYNIIELFDLGDTKLFEAAVLPAVLIGQKSSSSSAISNLAVTPSSKRAVQQPNYVSHTSSAVSKSRFVRIYSQIQEKNDASPKNLRVFDSVYAILENGYDGECLAAGQHFKVTSGLLSLPSSHEEPWSMVASDERSWLEKVNTHTKMRISDITKVRVGIKTTADDVFIRDDWDSLPDEIKPEKHLLRTLLSQDNAQRWFIDEQQTKHRCVLYTHTIHNGKRVAINLAQYPKAAAYLEMHRRKLSSRTYVTEANRQWYEIWVPQNPSLWQQPKIVFPDISPQPKFYYDDRGYIVDGNCYWITLSDLADHDLLFLIAGIANSHFMTCYHDLVFSNKLYAGRRRYLTQYVEKYPLPDPTSPESRAIVDIVRDLIFSSLTNEEKAQKERAIEVLIAKAFGVEPAISIVQATFRPD